MAGTRQGSGPSGPTGSSPGGAARTVTMTRRGRRRLGGWWWAALLLVPLLLGGLTALVTHAAVERDLETRTRSALEAGGLTGAGIAFSGRDGTISLSAGDADRARTVVDGVPGIRVADVAPDDTGTAAGSAAGAGADGSEASPTGADAAATASPSSPSSSPSSSPFSSPSSSPSSPSPSSDVSAACRQVNAEVAAELRANPVRFASGSTQLLPASVTQLRQIAGRLTDCLGSEGAQGLSVAGHTDDSGSDRTNQRISQERADAVAAALVAAGLPENVITSRGYGATRPVASNQSATGKAANRRVEIQLT